MAYYLGLDNGGTTTKAAVFDAAGVELASASTATEAVSRQPGFIERDMDRMWRDNCRVIRQALQRSRVKPGDIACVACCGHGKGLYLWGKDGAPVRGGILSTDQRAWRYPRLWERSGVTQQVFRRSCQHVLPGQPVALLAWLKDHEPEALRQTRWIFACKDYVRFCLTGQAMAERTDCSGNNLLNLHTGQYDPELLELFGLSQCLEKLPPLCTSTQLCGRVTARAAAQTGLAPGTPVAGGAFDIDACALAVGVTTQEKLCIIAGTWSINEYICRRPVLDGRVLMNSLFCLPGYYLVEECSPTSAGNAEWMIRTLLPELAAEKKRAGGDVYQQMNDWVESVPAEELCPVFLPFLMGSNVHPNARGAFVGVSSFHTRAHLARSVYEGVAFSHRCHVERLCAARERPPEVIRLAGGVGRSAVWTQMFADVMGMPVEVADVHETGALGCAMIGAAAVGEYGSLAQAAAGMSRVRRRVTPIARNQSLYESKYRLYLDVAGALDGVWDRMRRYGEGGPGVGSS